MISAVAEQVSPVMARRVTTPDLPIPFSGLLEDALLPGSGDIVEAVRALRAYKQDKTVVG